MFTARLLRHELRPHDGHIGDRPDVIHIFSPLRMYSSPDLRARVVMPAGFDPKPGSVNPKQPSFSPVASAGSHVFSLLF